MIEEEIKKFIIENKITTTEVADALGKTGDIPLCYPIDESIENFQVGNVKSLFCANGSNWELHKEVDNISENDIAIIFTENCHGKAIFGELVSEYILKIRKAKAIVVHGLVRDYQALQENRFPIWCFGKTPIGCVNKPSIEFNSELRNDIATKYDGGIAICDNNGVIVVQKKYSNTDFLTKLKLLKDQENVWSYCLREMGWNTHKTIVDKAYLDTNFDSPKNIKDAIERLKLFSNK